jgi:hypothetical protein
MLNTYILSIYKPIKLVEYIKRCIFVADKKI